MENHLALLIIDVQQAIVQDGLYRAETVVANIQKLLDKARADKIPVYYVQHEEPGLEHGTPGWQIVGAVSPLPGEKLTFKRYADSFYQTGLDQKLRSAGIDRLVIAGLQTEFCMDTAIRHAFSLGYKNVVACDAHSTLDSALLTAGQIIRHHESIWNNRFAELMPTDDICEQIL